MRTATRSPMNAKGVRRLMRRRSTIAVLMCAPLLAIVIGLIAYPFLYSMFLATLNKAETKFVGLDNFVFLFGRNTFWMVVQQSILFANEVSLRDATYLDPPAIPYYRGALVFRLLEHRLGAEPFRAALRSIAKEHAWTFADLGEFVRALGGAEVVSYYVDTTRLTDLVREVTRIEAGGVDATIVCSDPLWPGGRVPVVVRTGAGEERLLVDVRGGRGALRWRGESPVVGVEIDPERIYLDPVRSNNVR